MRGANILQLGIKELRGLARDPMLMILIAYAFSLSIYTASRAMPETLNQAAIAIVDEDRSPASLRIVSAVFPETGADLAVRDGHPYGCRPRHLRARHPARVPA
jgi:hypothetical protein